MVENFEFNNQNGNADNSSGLFTQVMKEAYIPETRTESQIAVALLDGDSRRTFDHVADSMASILERLQNLPESVRNEFFAGTSNCEGPAYQLARQFCHSDS